MKTSEALKITGSLSKPSKMPGWAYEFTCQRMQDRRQLAGPVQYVTIVMP